MVAVKNIADYVEDEMEEINNAAKIKLFTAHLLKERVTHHSLVAIIVCVVF
jgi:hypothetical protein